MDYQSFTQLLYTQIGVQENIDQRKNGEEQLNQIRQTHPNDYIKMNLAVLEQSQDIDIKKFSASQIRKNLSLFSEQSYINLWDKLEQDTKNFFKQKVFLVLQNESNNFIRKLLCEAIGEIGASLQEEYFTAKESNSNAQHQWGELVDIVWQMFQQDNVIVNENGFLILNTLISYTPEVFEDKNEQLFLLFQNGIRNTNLNIKIAAIQCLGSYVQVMDTRQLKKFDELTTDMLQAIHYLLDKDMRLGEQGLDVMESIAENEPKFFKKQFLVLFDFIKATFNMNDMEKTLKQQVVDICMSVVEKYPKFIQNHDQTLQDLCDHIFLLMVENDLEVTEEWQKPPEGFNDDLDDGEEDSTKFGMNCIDRFIQSIGEKKSLGIIGNTVQELLKQDKSWRHQYAAIMALSQVGEYIEDINLIAPTIATIQNYFKHQNPYIRYAVCHAIGQICDDMKPKFQQKYSTTILPELIQACDDQVPRVSSHAFAAITNFVESIDKNLIKDYLDPILKKSFYALQNGISLSKENAISTIAASAEAAKEFFVPYFGEAMPALFNLYNNHSQKEYRQLRGQTIECITLIAHGVPKETYMPFLEQIVNILITLQESQLEQVDPQKSYILSGWQRLCLIYHQEFKIYLNRIIPGLFRLVKNVFNQYDNFEDNQVNTYDKEETQIAIHMLAVFISQMKSDFYEYVNETVEILKPLCNFPGSDKIRTSAGKCLSCCLFCYSNPEEKIQACKQFIEVLYDAMSQEYDAEIICSHGTSIKECLEEIKSPCFNSQELQQYYDKIFKLLFDSDTRKAQNELDKNDQELDEDEKYQIEEENQYEEELHVVIAEIIGQLFRTHGNLCLEIAKVIYQNILPKVLDPKLSDKMHKFGIYLVCDMIQYLKYEHLSDIWQNLLEALVKYSQDKNLQVRQASIYGIGIYAQLTPVEVYQNNVQLVYQALQKAMEITTKNEQQYHHKYNNKCKDNIGSAYGKIIKAQNQNINIQEQITNWLTYLPMNNDRKEGLVNNYLLCDICIDSPQSIFINEAQIKSVLKIFSSIIGTKYATENLQIKIKESLIVLGKEQFVKDNWNALIADLEDGQKINLNSLLQN